MATVTRLNAASTSITKPINLATWGTGGCVKMRYSDYWLRYFNLGVLTGSG